MKAQLHTWFAALNEREKQLVIGTGFLLALYLFYSLIYSPLQYAVKHNAEKLQEKRATLIWMKQIKQNQSAQEKKQALNTNQLLSVLSTELKNQEALNLPHQLQQISQEDIQLSFEMVPFNALMEWLYQLQKHYIFGIKQLNIQRSNTAGAVRASIVVYSKQTN